MEISAKLAYEIYTISIFHIVALIILFSFSAYIFMHAKKTPLLYSYLAVVGTIALWMISKLLKTVAPTVNIRWFFIITQYFGVDFLGYFLVIFAFIYAKNKIPSKKQFIIWAIIPIISFIIVLTNPIHMSFYSYYDFYKDKFGPLFLPTQLSQYVYWLIGILMLSKNFTKQPVFIKKKGFSIFFAFITLIPLFANLYYILFKLSVFQWIFPFPVFDITPIAGTAALILFTIPALMFKFFDILPVSYVKLFSLSPYSIIFLDKKNILRDGNNTFYKTFKQSESSISLEKFLEDIKDTGKETTKNLLDSDAEIVFEIKLKDERNFRIKKIPQKSGKFLLYFTDITEIKRNHVILLQHNQQLSEINKKLDTMADNTRALSLAKTKSKIAQNVHDIMGHSLTVVIGITELAASDDEFENSKKRLAQASELITSSLNDLKNTFNDENLKWEKTSLISAIEHLKNENIEIDIAVHGDMYELKSDKTEAIFSMCREAVTNAIKHGQAKNMYLIFKYKKQEIEIYAIDNGKGCSDIKKNYGLNGIHERIKGLKGHVDFNSDGESGFTVHAIIPK